METLTCSVRGSTGDWNLQSMSNSEIKKEKATLSPSYHPNTMYNYLFFTDFTISNASFVRLSILL